MEIKDNRQSKRIPLSRLEPGKTFFLDTNHQVIYMRTEVTNGFNTVNIQTGAQAAMDTNKTVNVVKTTVMIE